MRKPKKILVCPLNWGLGHAARCVPLIRAQLKAGNEVVAVADGYPLKFLRQEFPHLRIIDFCGYPVRYSKRNSQVWAMLRLLTKLKSEIYFENKWLEKLLEDEHFDMIISDNRFGMWNKNVHSVYITHQIMVKMPKVLRFLEPIVYRLHKKVIEKYDECWIPDYAENGGLSGDLSHKYPLPKNARFIGILSRFSTLKDIQPNVEFDNVVILSGVEPQRTLFEQKMIDKFRSSKEKTLIIQGKPAENVQTKKVGRITIVSHLSTKEIAAVLQGCRTIISRSGYSTLMDFETLQVLKKAQFYPTPGQTEQEYLAQYLNRK